ncbi:MAG: tripartite tricarboxylate transporter TctB family protein [Alphaproteobacteria bacterium]|nr:tripartite tricarboxylate transporter TctB family protein [Pseudomonadota bacterium]TDI67795.1 MAG: tripartite tricarboxylate transporter TctB family protein [Alphaproteobacteria bacterium]
MRRADIISAALLLAFGLLLIFVVIPIWVPGHDAGNYGLRAQDTPYLTMFLVTGFSACLLVRRLFFDRGDDEKAPIPRQSWVFLLIASAVLVITLILLETIGILAGGPFVIAVLMYMMGERRPIAIAATAVLAPLLVWAFFWKLLQFPLP